MRNGNKILQHVATATVLLLAIVCARPTAAMIDPAFTPVDIYKNVVTIVQLEFSPLVDNALPAPKIIDTIKGTAPAAIAFDTSETPAAVRDSLDEQLGKEGTTGVLLLSNIGYNAATVADTDLVGAVIIGGKWYVLRKNAAATAYKIDDDQLNLRNVWAGSALMLSRCLNYLKNDPTASVPVNSGMKWAGERKLGAVPGKVTGVYAVDLFGDSKPCLLVTSLAGDQLYRASKDGPLEEVSTAVTLASKSQRATFGDFTGDGRMDIITWDGAQLLLLTQSAAEKFSAAPLPVKIDGEIYSLSAIDSGVLAATAAGPVLLRQLGAGTWEKVAIGAPPADDIIGSAGACVVADFDNDGITDLLQLFARGTRFHRGIRAGVFAAPVVDAMYLLPNLTVTMPGDYDADGLLDIVAVGDGGVVALRNLGKGHFMEQLGDSGEVSYDHYNSCSSGTSFDINNDGRQEFCLLFPDNAPQFFFNRGFFTTGVANDLLVGTAGGAHGAAGGIELKAAADLLAGQQGAAAADFNGDGLPEVALVAADGAVWLLSVGSDEVRYSLTVTLPARATGPSVVTAYDGPRNLGARLLQPDMAVSFGKVNKGALRLEWYGTDGKLTSKVVRIIRSTSMIAGAE